MSHWSLECEIWYGDISPYLQIMCDASSQTSAVEKTLLNKLRTQQTTNAYFFCGETFWKATKRKTKTEVGDNVVLVMLYGSKWLIIGSHGHGVSYYVMGQNESHRIKKCN